MLIPEMKFFALVLIFLFCKLPSLMIGSKSFIFYNKECNNITYNSPMSLKINVQLDSFNKIYREEETMTGLVEINSSSTTSYDSITAVLTGSYQLKNNKVSPPQTTISRFFIKKSVLAENGKIQADKSNFFNMKLHLTGTKENPLIESYQGVSVTIFVSPLFKTSSTSL